MRWSIRLGTIAGIKIELHVTFLLLVGWVALSQGVATGNPARVVAAVALLLLIFGCVLLHELGHALTARRFGIRTRDIVLLPIGGVARLERMPDAPVQEILVALAGPGVNLVIASVLYGVLFVTGGSLRPVFGHGILESLLAVNLLMIAFNMIPAFPMDGGRVLRATLALRMPFVTATRIAAVVGQTFALLFGIVGFFFNPMLMFVALFVFLAAGEEYALVQTRASLSGLPAHAAMLTEFHALEAHEPLQRAIDTLMAGSQEDFPVIEHGVPVGVLTKADLLKALQQTGSGTSAGSVVVRDALAIDPNEPLEAAFQRMRANGRTALPVVANGRLVGLLTLGNVSELLLVRDALQRHRPGA